MPDYQLSLAIGKEGQNARLAARLTGWRIDIRPDTAGDGTAGRGRRLVRGARAPRCPTGPGRARGTGRPAAAWRGPCPVLPTRRPCKLDDVVARRSPSPTRPESRASASPVRTCVGCGVRAAKSDLLRLVAAGDEIVPDVAARLPGRGAYLHPQPGMLGTSAAPEGV